MDCKNRFNPERSQFKKPVLLKVCLVLLVLAIIGSCVPARQTVSKMPLGDDGEIFVYLQSLPQEAGKVRFTIGEIAAFRADGSQTPLSLYFNELNGAQLAGEQKLLATGVLPPVLNTVWPT